MFIRFVTDHISGPEVGTEHHQSDNDLQNIDELNAEVYPYNGKICVTRQDKGQENSDKPGVDGVKEKSDNRARRSGSAVKAPR